MNLQGIFLLMSDIGRYRESSLHLALKWWVAAEQAQFEVDVNSYVIDVVQDDGLIEIQTGNFSAMKTKLHALLPDYAVRVLHPIAAARWLVTLDETGNRLKRRKSPKRGHPAHIFNQLVYWPDAIVHHPNLSIQVVMIHDEEIRVDDGKGSWRRKGVSIHDRHLLNVVEVHDFDTPHDFKRLLKQPLPPAFTTADIATSLDQPRRIAQRLAYCFKAWKMIKQVGKKGRANLFEWIA